ncbi:hypothetical protein KP004_14325 [Geomonas oryzisoli]|uniref:NAD glycohydrolase translocation F5/8 type C domain-containing protein n=1 Tax=Geomonas oryzisoli TaxID=2847992 RepID=A0ABX8J319_9BACT|nr:hypothetical protein [Geomonas oryzisoli]QWV92376.1 hypothetical protein KP004_14325 [Geomonas oryzisoli]
MKVKRWLLVACLTISTSVYAAQVQLIKSTLDGPATEEFGVGCSLGCAVGWDMKASSAREPQGKVKYDIKNIDDGKFNTAWVPVGNGIGETVSFLFKKKHFSGMKSTTFWGLELINGYAKSKKVWQENSRVKRLRIEHNDKPLFEVQLADSMEVQSVNFAPFTIRPGSIVKLIILETYPGTLYEDVAITELIPHGAH